MAADQVSASARLAPPRPEVGIPLEVAPGILLLRLPLPTRLNHINCYLFEDDDAWSVIDTGMLHEPARAIWTQTLKGLMGGRPIRRLLLTHFHIDHTGLAGWLHELFAPTFYMTQTEYLVSRVFESEDIGEAVSRQTAFFRECGLDTATALKISQERMGFRALRTPLPPTFERIRPGETIRLGGREWRCLTGAGHSVEQAMLYAPTDRIFISADQVLPEISPNISVGSMLPNADPLGDFLQSLSEIKNNIGDDVLVLPGHRVPFYGLHERIAELQRHHESRCTAVLRACGESALSALDLVPVIFGRTFGTDVIGMAVGEALAHANYLVRQGTLAAELRADGVLCYRTL